MSSYHCPVCGALQPDDPHLAWCTHRSTEELAARRLVLLSITDEGDREAVIAVFARVDGRRHQEALRAAEAEG